MRAADFSYGKPTAAQLRSAGYDGVFTYAGALIPAFNVTKAHAQDLVRGGIGIAVVLERQAAFMMAGREAGRDGMRAAVQMVRDAGLPDGPVIMAVDFDATLGGPTSPGSPGDKNMKQVLDTLQGGASVIGWDRVGIYGSKFVCDWIARSSGRPPAGYWQTEAWSHGEHFDGASAFQHAGTVQVGGVSCDCNDVFDGKLWTIGPGSPLPKENTAAADVKKIQASAGLKGKQIDGDWGKQTDYYCEVIRHNDPVPVLQAHLGLKADGIRGPKTVVARENAVRGMQSGLHVGVDGSWGKQTENAYLAASPLR